MDQPTEVAVGKEVKTQMSIGKQAPLLVEVSMNPKTHGHDLALVQSWVDKDGKVQYSQKGVHIPVKFALAVLRQAVKVYNEATGSNFTLSE